MEVDPRELVAIKVSHDFKTMSAEVVETAFLDGLIQDAPLLDENGRRIGTMVGFKIEPDGVLVEYKIDDPASFMDYAYPIKDAISFGYASPPEGLVGSSPLTFSLLPR